MAKTKANKRVELQKEAIQRLGILRKNGLNTEFIDNYALYNNVALIDNVLGVPFASKDYSEMANDELNGKIEWFENEYNCVVYLVEQCNTNFGMLYNFFYVSQHRSEWTDDRALLEEGLTYAYVWNSTDDILSEIGMIGFTIRNGVIVRIS